MGRISGAFIFPHPPIMIEAVGGRETNKVSKTINAAEEVAARIAGIKPDTIVVITPHGPMFRDAISIMAEPVLKGSLKSFGAPEISFELENDEELIKAIVQEAGIANTTAVLINEDIKKNFKINTALDHGAAVPLYFIEKRYTGFRLVHITYSMLSHEENFSMGVAIKNAVSKIDRNVVIVASSDLSHRLTKDAPAGYNEKGAEFDRLYIKLIEDGNILELMKLDHSFVEAAGECGYRSTIILFGALEGMKPKAEVLSYEGPFGVGYCVAQLHFDNSEAEMQKEASTLDQYREEKRKLIAERKKNEDQYVRLARKTLEEYVLNGVIHKPEKDLPHELLSDKAGVFVSIKKNGDLRGCIGTIMPTANSVAEEIINNAISAGTRDPRFLPVCNDELEELLYSVDILMPPEPIQDKGVLDVKRYGVIVSKGRKSGLLLPNLEGVDTIEEQLDIALQKAGISKNESYEMQRFEVIRHN